MATIRNLNSRLQQAQPMEPRGWFRWLHDHFAGRYGFQHDDDPPAVVRIFTRPAFQGAVDLMLPPRQILVSNPHYP